VEIGELAISTKDDNSTHPVITVADFTGNGKVSKLNLRSNNAAAATYYNNKQILSGSLSQANISKLTLGSYISQTVPTVIPGTTSIDSTGRVKQ